MGEARSSFGIGAGVVAALLIGIAIGVALPEPVPQATVSAGSTRGGEAVPAAGASAKASPDRHSEIVQAGFSPRLLAALDAVDAGDAQRARIDVRIVTAGQCGPTPAPGSDCLVETVAAGR